VDRVALYLQDKHPIREGMHYAQLAEHARFEAVWQAESRLVREATVPMAAFAAVTDHIDIHPTGHTGRRWDPDRITPIWQA